MVETLPWVNAFTQIKILLEKIKQVPVPPKFTHDFLASKLALKSSSYHAMIPLLKKLEFLDAGSIPRDNYKNFKDSSKSRYAMAQAVRKAYSKLYEYSEYPESLKQSELQEKIALSINAQADDDKVKNITGTFLALKSMADFEVDKPKGIDRDKLPIKIRESQDDKIDMSKLGINYTINITLPNTTDREVFEIIFETMKKHLLK